MQKIILLGTLLWAGLLPGTIAQTETSKVHVGTVNGSWDRISGTPSFLHLKGHAKIASDDYDLYADDITLRAASIGKLQEAVAVGGAVPGSQVIAHIRRPLESESSEIDADRAVYQPDRSRPNGGKMVFTGHVKVIAKSGFFAGPSVTTFEEGVTFFLGTGPDYPSINSGPGHTTLTPAQ